MKTCLRESCGKEFEPNKPKQQFCSDTCRVYFHREKSKKVDTERKADPLWEEFLKWKKEKATLEKSKIIDDILTTEINKPVSEKATLRYYEAPKLKEEVITNVEKKEAPKFRVITLEERIAAMEAAKNRK